MIAPIQTPLRGLVAVARERAFDGRVHVTPFEGECRLSITDMLASMQGLPDGFADYCEARINGELVPRDRWSKVYPKHNPFVDVSVTFTVPLRGSGGSSSGGAHKNPLAIIASIVVLLAAAAVSGGALGAFGSFAIGAATFTGAQVIGVGIGIAGPMASNALAREEVS
jgi:hypothetical protein